MTDPISISLLASSFASGVAKGLGTKVGEAIGENVTKSNQERKPSFSKTTHIQGIYNTKTGKIVEHL